MNAHRQRVEKEAKIAAYTATAWSMASFSDTDLPVTVLNGVDQGLENKVKQLRDEIASIQKQRQQLNTKSPLKRDDLNHKVTVLNGADKGLENKVKQLTDEIANIQKQRQQLNTKSPLKKDVLNHKVIALSGMDQGLEKKVMQLRDEIASIQKQRLQLNTKSPLKNDDLDLKNTGIGKIVNTLKKQNGTVAEKARSIDQQRKNMVAEEASRLPEEEDNSEKMNAESQSEAEHSANEKRGSESEAESVIEQSNGSNNDISDHESEAEDNHHREHDSDKTSEHKQKDRLSSPRFHESTHSYKNKSRDKERHFGGNKGRTGNSSSRVDNKIDTEDHSRKTRAENQSHSDRHNSEKHRHSGQSGKEESKEEKHSHRRRSENSEYSEDRIIKHGHPDDDSDKDRKCSLKHKDKKHKSIDKESSWSREKSSKDNERSSNSRESKHASSKERHDRKQKSEQPISKETSKESKHDREATDPGRETDYDRKEARVDSEPYVSKDMEHVYKNKEKYKERNRYNGHRQSHNRDDSVSSISKVKEISRSSYPLTGMKDKSNSGTSEPKRLSHKHSDSLSTGRNTDRSEEFKHWSSKSSNEEGKHKHSKEKAERSKYEGEDLSAHSKHEQSRHSHDTKSENSERSSKEGVFDNKSKEKDSDRRPRVNLDEYEQMSREITKDKTTSDSRKENSGHSQSHSHSEKRDKKSKYEQRKFSSDEHKESLTHNKEKEHDNETRNSSNSYDDKSRLKVKEQSEDKKSKKGDRSQHSQNRDNRQSCKEGSRHSIKDNQPSSKHNSWKSNDVRQDSHVKNKHELSESHTKHERETSVSRNKLKELEKESKDIEDVNIKEVNCYNTSISMCDKIKSESKYESDAGGDNDVSGETTAVTVSRDEKHFTVGSRSHKRSHSDKTHSEYGKHKHKKEKHKKRKVSPTADFKEGHKTEKHSKKKKQKNDKGEKEYHSLNKHRHKDMLHTQSKRHKTEPGEFEDMLCFDSSDAVVTENKKSPRKSLSESEQVKCENNRSANVISKFKVEKALESETDGMGGKVKDMKRKAEEMVDVPARKRQSLEEKNWDPKTDREIKELLIGFNCPPAADEAKKQWLINYITRYTLSSKSCKKCKDFDKEIKTAPNKERRSSAKNRKERHEEDARMEDFAYDLCRASSIEHIVIDFAVPINLKKDTIGIFCVNAKDIAQIFLMEKHETIGEKGRPEHPDAVISMLHHALAGYHGKDLLIHADNAFNQNKNWAVIAYLAWRSITALNPNIRYMMRITGHTRCGVDTKFQHIKKLCRSNGRSTHQDLVDAINEIKCKPLTYSGGQNWKWRSWKKFLADKFNKVSGISIYHHFRYCYDERGICYMKTKANHGIEDERRYLILKPEVSLDNINADNLPNLITLSE